MGTFFISLFVFVFMLVVDYRLNKIYKEMALLNKGMAYFLSIAEKRATETKR